MRKLFILLVLLSLNLFAQELPVAGKNFTIQYDPSEKGIFTSDSKLFLVYVFDYWGTKFTYSGAAEGLFKNVLYPDEGRQKSVEMKNQQGKFFAEIPIPQDAQLLSYYITDGTNFDYNDKKTYVSYIYEQEGNPVKRARFRNIDFLIMAGATPEEYIVEIKKELEAYPDDHLVRSVYWSKVLESQNDYNSLLNLQKEYENEFNELRNNYGNIPEFIDAEARVYYSFYNSLSKIISPIMQSAIEKIYELAHKIPEEKRSSVINKIYQSLKQQKEGEKFGNELIGKSEIDFEFTTITGEKKKLSDLKGKFVLLDFWGTWCGPCVGEIPNLVKVYNKFKDKDFEIVSISSDLVFGNKTETEFSEFVEKNNMTWTIILDDKDETIHKLYKINHWPTLFLIDKNGVIIKGEDVLRDFMLEKTLEEVIVEK